MSVGQNSMRRLHNAFCALVYIYLLAPIVVVATEKLVGLKTQRF